MRLIPWQLLFATVFLLFPAWSVQASEDIDHAKNAANRINVATRQGMRVERMTKAACFAMGGVDADKYGREAREELEGFDTAIEGLRSGHDWLGLLPEGDEDLLGGLEDVESHWQMFRAAILQIIHEDYQSVVISQIQRDREPLVQLSNFLSDMMTKHYGPEVFEATLTQAVARAAYQRLLGQRMIRQFCFAYFDIGGDELREALQESMAEFEQGLDILNNGGDGIAPPPNATIKRNLRTVGSFWKKLRPALDAAARGAPVADADLKTLLRFEASMLKQLNQASEAYIPRTSS